MHLQRPGTSSEPAEAGVAASRPGNRSDALAWLGLAVAFSPVIVDLVGAALRSSWGALRLALPALLIAIAAAGGREGARAWRQGARGARAGLALLATGLLLEVAGIAGYSLSIARLGLPIGVLGVALWRGWPSLPVAVLAFGVVPIPDTVRSLASPELESALAEIAAGSAAALGGSVSASGPVVRGPAGDLHLTSANTGVGLAALLGLLGWYAAVRLARPIRSALRYAALGVLAAVPVQGLTVLAAVSAVAAGHPQLAGRWILPGAWLLFAAAGPLAVELRRAVSLRRTPSSGCRATDPTRPS